MRAPAKSPLCTLKNQVDDGPAYEKFLSEALPLFGPTRKIGWLVTSRLEKYRNHTGAWLQSTTSNTTS
ncbi:hypothetical protein [Mesorhizobium sp.]|uniref:hypothetical protein n=1 Tax=Mesorhizobium sp. TaxID=1871066 RepID=UPI00257A83F8|nr:hypothetical protein [Mesorhizobium sp.]